jgi:myo-inositol-1(or 4)-monophosphatase
MKSIEPAELAKIYQFAIQLGRDAGKILRDGIEKRRLGGGSSTEDAEKINAVDIVTQTDNGNQALLHWNQYIEELNQTRCRGIHSFLNR